MAATQSRILFISYSHRDRKLVEQFRLHLGGLKYQGLLSEWHDRLIKPGADWDVEIDENLDRADIVLLMVSPGFIGSKYCIGVELKKAMARHRNRKCVVVPVVLRPVVWEGFPFYKLQGLPSGVKPVTDWKDRDSAFADVVRGIRRVIDASQADNSLRAGEAKAETSIPTSDVFLNHTSFLRKEKQKEFQEFTGIAVPHYDIRVIVDSFNQSVLDDIKKVRYILPEAYPRSTYTKTRRHRKEYFQLREVANGEYLLIADVYFRNRAEPLRLTRYITLWHSGPQLV